MNLKTLRNNSDARQQKKITFRNTYYQSSPNIYTESTSQNNQQKNMGQINTHNTNQQSTEQQRSSPQRYQEEKIKRLSLYLILKTKMMLPVRINIFYSKVSVYLCGQ